MNSTVATEIAVSPFRPLAEYVGQELGYRTHGGEVILGITEIGTSVANQGALIVRFPDGRWGFATTTDAR